MHGHLCVVWWLFSSPVSFSSPFRCSSSRPSRRPPPSSTRSSCPKTCATSAWGPWPVMTTRHPSQKRVHAATHASAKHNVLEVVRNTMQVLLLVIVRACRLPVHSCFHYRGRMMNATRCVLQSRALTHRTTYVAFFWAVRKMRAMSKKPPSVIHRAQSHLWEALLRGTVGQRRGTKRHGEIPEVVFRGIGMLSSNALLGYTQ